MTRRIEREMSITHAEFRRVLQVAFPGAGIDTDRHQTEFDIEDGRVRIILSPQTRRRIGNLSLPVTNVVLEFGNLSEDEIQDFMQRFTRSFQRGGG